MNIDIRDTLTLDDKNHYLVVSKINYEYKNYYYLVDKDDFENIIFCYEDNEDLVELVDNDLITKLLPLFLESSKDIIDEIKNNNGNI